MKRKIRSAIFPICFLGALLVSCQNSSVVTVSSPTDSTTLLSMDGVGRYLIVPIEESATPLLMSSRINGKETPFARIRLADKKVDYEAPVFIPDGAKEWSILHAPKDALFKQQLRAADDFQQTATYTFRPKYHFIPSQGWIGHTAGAIFQDGSYHLYYECNPQASKAENFHWGHSVSNDGFSWQEQNPILNADSLGECLGGSVVKDTHNTLGAGNNSLIAIYSTTRGAGESRRQEQCVAFSKDGGGFFQKYDANPVLRTYDDLPDFRHPGVFRYRQGNIWMMVVSCSHELRIYSSEDLVHWNLESYIAQTDGGELISYAVGEHPSLHSLDEQATYLYESAQLVEVSSQEGVAKWVLLCNLSKSGQSYTACYVGDFDGKKFKPESNKLHQLDAGTDFSGVSPFQGVNGRCLLAARLANDAYSDLLPTFPYRGQMALLRELSIFKRDGEWDIKTTPEKALTALRRETQSLGSFAVQGEKQLSQLLKDNSGAYELTFDVDGGSFNFDLSNQKGEKVTVSFDASSHVLSLNRESSGVLVEGMSKLSTCQLPAVGKKHSFRIFVDTSSIELFVDDGDVALSDLIFPSQPYNALRFIGAGLNVSNLNVYPLQSKD